MEMPLVSIIVPVYNAQSHLSRCLESICGQEYRNLELIVINDGSKDKSLPVCEEFRKKDSRILLVDKANSGVSDTRNLGLKLAGCKYVQFVDSDDYIAPDYTARLVEAAEKTGADLVISPYTMVIPAGRRSRNRCWKRFRTTSASCMLRARRRTGNTVSCPRASTTRTPSPAA